MYERLTPAGKRPGFRTLVATQLVSGVWHGLFPGYWLFFATSAVVFEAGKTLYRCASCGGWRSRCATLASHACWHPCLLASHACISCLLGCTLAAPLPPSNRPCRYEQAWPAGAARFPPYMALKVVVNAVLLNYSAAAFQVGTRWRQGGVGLFGWAGLAG